MGVRGRKAGWKPALHGCGFAALWTQAGVVVCLLLIPLFTSCSQREKGFTDLGPGLAYQNQQITNVPWSIHVLRLDRAKSDFEFHSVHANGAALGLSPLSEQIESLRSAPGLPVAGLNGDFYQFAGRPYEGDPRGLQIMDGEVLSAPNGGVVFWIGLGGEPCVTNVASRFQVVWPGGVVTPFGLNERRLTNSVVLYTPAIGRSTRTAGGRELVLERAGDGAWLPLRMGQTITARVRKVRDVGNTRLTPDTMVLSIHPLQTNRPPDVEAGALLTLSLGSSPSLRGITTAIGGGPILVHHGKIQKIVIPEDKDPLPYEFASMRERHPRSALGWNDRYYYLVAVDGRQKKVSVGMTLDELAGQMRKLGCQEVINCDGGGSSTLWCNGWVMNNPCDGDERGIANGLAVVRKSKEESGTRVAHLRADH